MKGPQQQRKGWKQPAGMFEPLVIRRSCAPGKMGGYGRATAGRLPEAGWLTERPLSLHLNKGPCRLMKGDTLTHPGAHTRVAEVSPTCYRGLAPHSKTAQEPRWL